MKINLNWWILILAQFGIFSCVLYISGLKYYIWRAAQLSFLPIKFTLGQLGNFKIVYVYFLSILSSKWQWLWSVNDYDNKTCIKYTLTFFIDGHVYVFMFRSQCLERIQLVIIQGEFVLEFGSNPSLPKCIVSHY